jgi:hypothetical protein
LTAEKQAPSKDTCTNMLCGIVLHMPILNNLISKKYDVIILGGAFPVYDKNTFQLNKCQALAIHENTLYLACKIKY